MPRPLDVLTQIIGEPSVLGNEEQVLTVLGKVMTDLGYDRVEFDDVGNLIGIVRGTGSAPPILFDGHVDVVPPGDLEAWPSPPFQATLDDGFVIGRGSVDMKGPVVAMIFGVALARGSLSGDAIVCCSVMEETMEGAALGPVLDHFCPRAVVIAEPSNLRLCVGQRGRAEVQIVIYGRQAHSAFPEMATNPIQILQRFLMRLDQMSVASDSLLGQAICIPTDVVSDPLPANSVTPYVTKLTVDRRLLAGETQDGVVAPLLTMLEASTGTPSGPGGRVSIAHMNFETWRGFQFSVAKFAPGWKMDVAAPVVTVADSSLRSVHADPGRDAYRVCTNGSAAMGIRGIPTIGYGPGDPAQSHQVAERLPLTQLAEAVEGYAALARGMTGKW